MQVGGQRALARAQLEVPQGGTLVGTVVGDTGCGGTDGKGLYTMISCQ